MKHLQSIVKAAVMVMFCAAVVVHAPLIENDTSDMVIVAASDADQSVADTEGNLSLKFRNLVAFDGGGSPGGGNGTDADGGS